MRVRGGRTGLVVSVAVCMGIAASALVAVGQVDPRAKRAGQLHPPKPAEKAAYKTALLQAGLEATEKELAWQHTVVGDRGFLTTVIDVSVYDSWDGYGDASNNVPIIDIAAAVGLPSGTAVTITGAAYDVIIDTLTPGKGSYLNEARMYFDDNIAPDGSGLVLTPGYLDNFAGVGTYSSGGIIDLTGVGIPDIPLPNGMLRLEFFEGYDDSANNIDANYNVPSTITVEVEDPTSTGACCNDVTTACVGTISRAACEATAGQTWYIDESCPAFTCPGAVAGDDCGLPIVVDFATDLPYSDIGQTTCGRVDDYDLTCLGSYDGGEDILYELDVPSDTCINVSMTSDATWVGMAIDNACPPDATCVAKVTSTGSSLTITSLTLTAGTYYLMLDTYPAPDCIGSFDLSITECPAGGACCHSDASCDDVSGAGNCVAAGDLYMGDGTECTGVTCPSPGDTCLKPLVVTLGVADLPYTDDNTNCGRVDDYDDPSTTHCLYYYDSGEDMIYELDVTEQMTVRVGLDPHGTTYPGVAIGDACPPTDSCLAADYQSGATPPLDTGCVTLAPGTYYIQVDTWSTPDCIPDFTLTVTECPAGGACCHQDGGCDDVAGAAFCVGAGDTYMGDGSSCAGVTCPPGNDQCPGEKVACGDTLTGQTTVAATKDYDDLGTCTGYNQAGADVAYELTLPYEGEVTVTVQNVSGFDPSFYVVLDCGDPAACIAGADAGYTGDDETATFTATAGTYYIIVDTYSSTGQGTFDLDVQCVEALDGACCLGGGTCSPMKEGACETAGGEWAGPGTDCAGSGAGGGTDCNNNDYIDFCELHDGAPDCQPNDVLDVCDISSGTSEDCQGDGIPDECQLTDVRDVIISEGFEGTFPPAGWTNVALAANGPWILNSTVDYVHTGAQSSTHPWSTPNYGDSYLMTPELTLTTATLKVWSLGCGEGSQPWCDYYDIDVMIVVGAPGGGDDIFVGNLNELWTGYFETWAEGVYNLTPLLPAGPFKIGFRYYGLDGDLGAIDDVLVEGSTGPLANDCNANGVPDECDDPVCGNDCLEGGAGHPAEECDGTLDEACPGLCYPVGHAHECMCPFCGDGIVGPGEQCDGGDCCTATCTFKPNTTTCRAAAGVCDAVEYCTGAAAACPADGFLTSVCRASTGPCDPAEMCDGVHPACPANTTITACINGDGCCPAGCNAGNDNNCIAVCGNNIKEPGEQCDGTDAAACPGACEGNCTCPVGNIPTVSQWGMMIMGLVLLIGARVYFRRRSARAAG